MPITDISQLDPSRTYSYADYLTWQFDELVELLRGRFRRMSPSPMRAHQDISLNLAFAVKQYLRGKTCRVYEAPFDVRLPGHPDDPAGQIFTVVQPDICVICDPGKLDARGCNGAPDWIVEILSPGTATYDWKHKFDLYEEAGVGEYWIISPGDRNISVFVLRHSRYALVAEYAQPGPVPCYTLPELVIEWAEVFEGV